MAPAPDAKAQPRPSLPGTDVLSSLPQPAIVGLACECAAQGDVEGLRQLVKAGADANQGTPYDKRTPLHLAAAAGHLDMARFLVEECGALLQRDRFGLLPIHDAAQNGHGEVRRYLQERKLAEVPALGKTSLTGRDRSQSLENVADGAQSVQSTDELVSSVFELVVKEGIFSYNTVHAEVQHFFRNLNLHPVYFEHFTPYQIAKHVQCLIAAKHVARATADVGSMEFMFKTPTSGFFLAAIDSPTPTAAQRRIEEKVAEHLSPCCCSEGDCMSLTFMASEGPVFAGSRERLGIFATQRSSFDAQRVSEDETSLEVLASARFLREKTRQAREQYQILMEDIVASRRSVARVVPGSVYPGPFPGGFVVLFGTAETTGRHYFPEVCQAMRHVGLSPRRFYVENFANGAITYSLFFPTAVESEVRQLSRTILCSTHLSASPGRSAALYNSVLQARLSHEVGLYVHAAVRFVYVFFPKEQYSREYTTLHRLLENDPNSQRRLEALYKLCMKELLSTDRIYDLIQRHLDLAVRFFEDFRSIALGETAPHFSEELAAAIESRCPDDQDRQILRMFLTFNESLLVTNFFQAATPGAFAFRLNPQVALKNRPAAVYPEVPYGIYLVCGRDFLGFHVRFRDVARGGIRLVQSRDTAAYERSFATLFDECYNLAHTQQNKNKDIPEGGAKGILLPDPVWTQGGTGAPSAQSPAAARSCFSRYLDALLDCMLPEQSGVFAGHLKCPELLYFGPDENTAGFMDLGAELARQRGYPYWRALTTGKSVRLGGVPHDVYGMTTASVHTYVTELLKKLGEDEEAITKFQTGGPDGDLGSNEILVSRDRTIAVVDGSGVLYDPAGIDRSELTRLARRRIPVKEFSRSCLGSGGFLVTIDEVDVRLPDGSKWRTGAALRDAFHLTDYATADLFVPCGGRPNAVTTENVKSLFAADGVKPKFRMVVEGANLFFSDGARDVLEKAGVHVFKDASTNKGGVNSSSLEVFAALALPPEEHAALMTYNPDGGKEPPEFYTSYVKQILDIIIENAEQEFKAIWACNTRDGIPKVEATRQLSRKITRMQDSIQENLQSMPSDERDQLVRSVLRRAVPPLMVQHLTVDGILRRVPPNYVTAVVGAWVASRFVYRYGINASEMAFFFFLRSLISDGLADTSVANTKGSTESLSAVPIRT